MEEKVDQLNENGKNSFFRFNRTDNDFLFFSPA